MPENADFQFHKGTIKTLERERKYHLSPYFQFHKGTIKTEFDETPEGWDDTFNSIKVRLKRVVRDDWADRTGLSIP